MVRKSLLVWVPVVFGLLVVATLSVAAAPAGLLQSWQVEAVDSTDSVGMYTSLALNRDEYPRISYFDATNRAIKYASHGGGLGWTVQTVDHVQNLAAWTLDSDGLPHLAYLGTTSVTYA